MKKQRVLIFIVCFLAEKFIEGVLKRIPQNVWENDRYETEILIIDDQSSDETFNRACLYAGEHRASRITVLYNPKNQGYGGNQKIGYHYAIEKKFDHVVLLHGDGQYAPELLSSMIEPLLENRADVVFGSRMVSKTLALKGGMPLYKWLGNQLLTFLQNTMLGSSLSEFHTGYRAFRVSSLASIPFQYNSDYFDFDTDIIIQLLDIKSRIEEIPIPTFYGEEISRVNSVRYGLLILATTAQSRIMKWGIFYHPKFDYEGKNFQYPLKIGYPSSHQFALQRIKKGMNILDISVGPSPMTNELFRRGVRVTNWTNESLDGALEFSTPDQIFLLDFLEHLKSPEQFLSTLQQRFCRESPTVLVTSGNVAFVLLRLSLLAGNFNYSKRGILDLSHIRLFTFQSLRRMLEHHGFDILEEEGIPAPFPLALGSGIAGKLLLRLNLFLINISPTLFSFQMAFVVKPRPTLALLLENAVEAGKNKRKTANLPFRKD